MDDYKKITRQFIQTYISFILVVAALVTGVLLLGLWITDQNIFFIVLFIAIFILMFMVTYYQTKIERITNISFLIRIRSNQGAPLQLKYLQHLGDFERNLKKQGYKTYKSTSVYTLFYKTEVDIAKRMNKRYMLDIVVYISDQDKPFYNDSVDDTITALNQSLLSKKMKVNRMFVTQIKHIDTLDEKTKDEIKEIVFFRSRKEIISTVNIGIHLVSNQAVMLYSDTYSPSIYYTYHIDQIKSFI